MKLLVDENLAPVLAQELKDLFPGSAHVTEVGLGSTPVEAIWAFAAANGFTFLTKDKDFANLSMAVGPPPKVVVVRVGNSTTKHITMLIRSNAIRVSEFENDKARGLLLLR